MGSPGSPTVATEWSVEARAGGKCVVRVVHSLFASTDNWDNQLDGLEQGWPTYFRILRLYLEKEGFAVVAANDELKEALKGDDLDAIRSKTEALMQAFQRLGQAMYAQQQAAGAEQQQAAEGGGGSGPPPAGDGDQASSGDGDVVEGEIVDEGGAS